MEEQWDWSAKKKKKEAGGALTRSNRRGEHKVEWHEMHEMGTVPERAWSERERKYGERIGAQRSALKSPLKRLPCRDKSWIHAHAARLQFDLEDGQTLGRFPLLNAECAGLRRTSYSVSAFRVLTNPTFFFVSVVFSRVGAGIATWHHMHVLHADRHKLWSRI